jgi:hypothetical protein
MSQFILGLAIGALTALAAAAAAELARRRGKHSTDDAPSEADKL